MRISSLLSLCAAPIIASALTLNAPTNRVIGGVTNITWVSAAKDWPRWTLFLMGTTDPFDLRAIVARDIDPSVGYITTTFPVDRVKPGVPYVLKAVNVTNVDWVLANSPSFTVTTV